MKKLMTFSLICYSFNVIAQNPGWIKDVDPWLYENYYLNTKFKIGDQFPDIDFGKTINNKTGKNRFSSFRGKALILSFWGSGCTSCWQNFSKLEQLQNIFNDELQILLVNVFESKEEIEKKISSLLSKKGIEEYYGRLPDLPSLIADSNGKYNKLNYYFPTAGWGHQIWIDKSGKIVLRGSHHNATVDNIKLLLNGKRISILNDNGTAPRFNKALPYINLIGQFKHVSPTYGSFFTPFNNEYNPEGASFSEAIVDTSSNVKRFTYVNFPIADLWIELFRKSIGGNKLKIIGSRGKYDRIIFSPDIDTSNFMCLNGNGAECYKSRVCYEQFVSSFFSQEKRHQLMLRDLNQYTLEKFGVMASVENRVFNCYSLISILAKNDAKTVLINNSKKVEMHEINGQLKWKLTNSNIMAVFSLLQLGDILKNDIENIDDRFFIVDDSGTQGTRKLNMEFPINIKSITELRNILISYGFDLTSKRLEIPMIVIKKHFSPE